MNCSPIRLFNQAFGYPFNEDGEGLPDGFVGLLADTAKLRSRGDIAEKLLTARNVPQHPIDMLCPGCGHAFRAKTTVGVTSVWCGYGPCKLLVSNEGVTNADDISESETALAERLVKIVEDAR